MSELKSAKLFTELAPYLAENKEALQKKANYVYCFEVSKKKGEPGQSWTINVKEGTVSDGKVGKIDATFIITDDDMLKLVDGTLNPQTAFLQGKMKIKGNLGAATKFTPDLLPKKANL